MESTFQRTGLSLALDGSQDAQIKFPGQREALQIRGYEDSEEEQEFEEPESHRIV